MIVLLPVSLFGQEGGGAILRSTGTGVSVNNSAVPVSIAIFPNDLVETPKGAAARIEATGSSIDLNPETMVQFSNEELVLDHGSLSVNTSRGMRVRVGCITVTPVNPVEWTHYEVTDVDGKVTVHSSKSDVYVDARSKNRQDEKKASTSTRDIVHETEQKSRDDKCGAAYFKADRIPGLGAWMNSTTAKILGAVIVGTVACIGLCHGDDPISPHKP